MLIAHTYYFNLSTLCSSISECGDLNSPNTTNHTRNHNISMNAQSVLSLSLLDSIIAGGVGIVFIGWTIIVIGLDVVSASSMASYISTVYSI